MLVAIPPRVRFSPRLFIRTLGWAGLCGAWLAAVGFGLTPLWQHAFAPGEAATAPAVWPADTSLVRDPDAATLVFVAHPHCPCTRASLDELTELLPRLGGPVRTYVLMLQPSSAPDGWTESALRERAATLPGMTVVADVDGAEARRFGTHTSGQVLLYDAAGALRFAGGLTPARGHASENAGRAALASLVRTSPEAAHTAVFGCPLETPAS
jgi:hypothetical protein